MANQIGLFFMTQDETAASARIVDHIKKGSAYA
jgi:hypothetical protein